MREHGTNLFYRPERGEDTDGIVNMAERRVVPRPTTTGQTANCQCCDHAKCMPLKASLWCRHWIFLRWEASRIMMPFEMATELRDVLRGRNFVFYAVRTVVGKTTVFEILVRLESDDKVDTLLPKLGMPNGYNARESRVWTLNCCLQALNWDTEVWTKSLRYNEDGVTFGDDRVLRRLVDEVRSARETAGRRL